MSHRDGRGWLREMMLRDWPHWYRRTNAAVAAAGLPTDMRDRLAAELPPRVLLKAQRLARDWRPIRQ